jgi:hypothetical protein
MPEPLTRRRAAITLAALAVFALGFALAGVLVAAHQGGTPAYWCLVTLGLLGIGALGLSQPRTLTDTPRPPVWSRAGLAAVAQPLGLPAGVVARVFYALIAVGVVGNLLLPAVVGRR